MSTTELLGFNLLWGIIGCAGFTIFVIIAFKSGFVYLARDRDVTLKRDMPLQGYLAMSMIPLAVIALQIISSRHLISRKGFQPKFYQLWLINSGMYLIFAIYDTFVIDYLVMAVWRPQFLSIPAEMSSQSLAEYIRISIPVALIFGILFTTISSFLVILV